MDTYDPDLKGFAWILSVIIRWIRIIRVLIFFNNSTEEQLLIKTLKLSYYGQKEESIRPDHRTRYCALVFSPGCGSKRKNIEGLVCCRKQGNRIFKPGRKCSKQFFTTSKGC